MQIAHVSTFAPLRCGIATFATDLIGALGHVSHLRYSLHYGAQHAVNVAGSANVNALPELVALARQISADSSDLVCLQHEFGIWGGREGEHVHTFLDNLSKPIVAVLHTTFGPGDRTPVQREILDRLVRCSARVVVLTTQAKHTLQHLLGRQISSVAVIPHGVPECQYVCPPPLWDDKSPNIPFRLVTPGFFREDKGFEAVLLAMWRLRRRGKKCHYLIVGEPQGQFTEQQRYSDEVCDLIESLNLRERVAVDLRYLPLADQLRAIQSCHFGIFAYQDPAQSSSGTIPLVLSAGRPVICTPFEYALAKRLEMPGGVIVADKFGASTLSDTIANVIEKSELYEPLPRTVFDTTRAWTWPIVSLEYVEQFRAALTDCGMAAS